MGLVARQCQGSYYETLISFGTLKILAHWLCQQQPSLGHYWVVVRLLVGFFFLPPFLSTSSELPKPLYHAASAQLRRKNSRFSHEAGHMTRILESGTPLSTLLGICGESTDCNKKQDFLQAGYCCNK